MTTTRLPVTDWYALVAYAEESGRLASHLERAA